VSTDLEVRDDNALSATLFGTDNPAEVVQRAAVVATALADLVHKQNLVVRIGQSEHVRVEGWTLLGSMLGVFPIVTWTRPILKEHDTPPTPTTEGWEARVEARTRNGEIVGAAEAECMRSEDAWGWTPTNKYGKPLPPRDDYALRSMAQTRAVSKALRLPLGFVMQLAGFNPTPAEEMVAPTVDMYDPDIPFGDAPQPQLQPPKFISEKQCTRLWTLAQKAEVDESALRAIVLAQTGQESTKQIKVGREYDAIVAALGSGTGNSQALEPKLEAPESGSGTTSSGEPTADAPGHGESPERDVPQHAIPDEAASPDEILALSARLIGSSSDPQGAAYKIEQHASTHAPEEHLAWLLVQARKRFGGGDAT
jgi:hypothetical protein